MAKKGIKFDINAEDKSQRAFRSVKNRIGSIATTIRVMGPLIKAAFIAVGVSALIKFTKSTVNAGDELQKMSIRLGASTEALSQYRHVAEIGGTSLEGFATSLKQLVKSASDAEQGLMTPKRAFDQLGLSVLAFKQLRPTQQFEMLAEAISKIKDPADRVRIAMDLMGRQGVVMLSVMDGGAAGIARLRAEADDLGLTLTRTEADSMATFNDTLVRLGNSFKGVGQKLAIGFLPYLQWMTQGILDVIPMVFGLTRAFKEFFGILDQPAAERMADIADQIAFLNERIAEANTDIIPDFRQSGNVERMTKKIGALTQEYKELNNLLKQTQASGDGFADKLKSVTEIYDALAASTVEVSAQSKREDAARQKALQTLRLENAQREQLISATRRGGDEVLRLTRAFDLENAAMRLGIDFTTQQGQEWAEAYRHSQDLAQGLEDLERLQKSSDRDRRIDFLETQTDALSGFERGLLKIQKQAEDLATSIDNGLAGAFKSAEDAFVNFVQTGKLSFQDLANSIIADLARIAFQQQITAPLAGILGNIFSPGGTAAAGGGIGASASGSVAASTGSFSISAQPFHSGGIVGQTSGPTRQLAIPLGGIPRLHNGLAADEFPAILQRGEEVIPRGGQKSGVTVNVSYHRTTSESEPVTVKESTSADGERILSIMITDTVKRQISNGGLDQPLRGRFNLTPSLRN